MSSAFLVAVIGPASAASTPASASAGRPAASTTAQRSRAASGTVTASSA
ncbi:MAG TPA: hypothetical protein VGL33_18920 [Streptosporangiaceae bacterium]